METLSQAIETLKKEGYTINFTASDSKVVDVESKNDYSATDLDVKAIHRFEGMTNPDDMSILYALETKDGKRGLLVDAYGANDQGISAELAQKLNR